MTYAIIENGVVTNLIWLYEGNAAEFSNAVPLGDRPVTIGDAYANGRFTHGGANVLTSLEAAKAELTGLAELLRSAASVYALLPESIRAIIAKYAAPAEN